MTNTGVEEGGEGQAMLVDYGAFSSMMRRCAPPGTVKYPRIVSFLGDTG